MRIYKKPRPFRHLFVADRILRAWYRGIKNAGSRKRAQGRAQDIPYHHTIYTYKYHVLYMYLIDYLYHILPFCLARWSLLRSVEAFVFKKCPACSLVMWHVEWRIVPSGVSIGRRMLAFCFFCPGNPQYHVLWENRVWPKEPLAQDPRKTKWCRGRFPLSSQVLQKDFLQKKTPHKSGFDSSTSSNDSEEPSHCHKIPRISVAVYKENLILIATCKSRWNSACDEWDMLKSSRAQERARAKRKGS